MKRNLFWLVMGGLAVGWVVAHHRPDPPRFVGGAGQLPPGFVVVHENGKVIVSDPHHRVVTIDGRPATPLPPGPVGQAARGRWAVRDGGRIVVYDRKNRVVSIDNGPARRYDADEDDDREAAEGLPVPIVPGTRTTVATAEPPRPPAPPQAPRRPYSPRPRPQTTADGKLVTVVGLRSATAERARESAFHQFERTLVDDVLHDEVRRGWHVPRHLLGSLVREVNVVPVVRDYGTVYEATLKADLSPPHRGEVVHAYRQEEVRKRLWILGGVLAFVLVCLAVVSGYIKADEATKGYYTARLRTAAVVALGVGATLVYQWYTRS